MKLALCSIYHGQSKLGTGFGTPCISIMFNEFQNWTKEHMTDSSQLHTILSRIYVKLFFSDGKLFAKKLKKLYFYTNKFWHFPRDMKSNVLNTFPYLLKLFIMYVLSRKGCTQSYSGKIWNCSSIGNLLEAADNILLFISSESYCISPENSNLRVSGSISKMVKLKNEMET